MLIFLIIFLHNDHASNCNSLKYKEFKNMLFSNNHRSFIDSVIPAPAEPSSAPSKLKLMSTN